MEEIRLTCINCPLGCELTASVESSRVLAVACNQCKLGIAYAEKEVVSPMRMATTTVRLGGAAIGAAPVRSASPVPRNKVAACVAALKNTELTAPVRMGQVVFPNICDTGVDMVATREIPASAEATITATDENGG